MPDVLPPEYHAGVSFGILLLASLIAGILADVVRIPKVTAYLLAGMLVGPGVLDAVGSEHMHSLEPLTKLAMGLVLLELGCQFQLSHLRPILKHAVYISAGELLMTFACVATLVWAFGFGLGPAVLLGALALATAPATTVLVLKESRSEGPVTELASVLVAINNIAAIVVFELLFLVARLFASDTVETSSSAQQVQRLLMDLGGASLMGLLGGLLISYGSGLLNRRRWLVMVIAVSILLLGLSESWHVPYMLVFLVAGITVVNTTQQSSDLIQEQEKISGLLVVVFFAVHGAELQLPAFVAAGSLGAVYICSRSAGKLLGIGLAANLHKEAATVRKYLGSCMLAQAGAAIGLAAVAAQRWPEIGTQLETVILGSVVFFEIVGPILTRRAVLQAGEVPLAQAIIHRTETPKSQAAKMWIQAREALGISARSVPNIAELAAKDLLRGNEHGLSQTANFEEVLKHIRRSRDNTYVVLDDDRRVVGLIRYESLSNTFFDSSIDSLVRAEDLTSSPGKMVYPESPMSEVVDAFRFNGDDVLPVVASEAPHAFLGVIRRSDVTELAVRIRR